MRRGLHPTMAEAILGHRVKKELLQNLSMTISNDDLIKAIYMMRFDVRETEIWGEQ